MTSLPVKVSPTLAEVAEAVAVLEQAVSHGAPAALPSLVGDFARLTALASLRVNATASSTPMSAPAAAFEVLTTKRLSALWQMPEAKIRDLCRTGRLPAKKLGGKEWVISVAALREWVPKQPLAEDDNLRLSSSHEPRRASQAPHSARPYTVEVRRPVGRPQSLARSDGGGDARDPRHDQAPTAPARRTRAARDRSAEGASEVHSSPEVK